MKRGSARESNCVGLPCLDWSGRLSARDNQAVPDSSCKPVSKVRPGIPAPATAEGELFHYTPDEAAQWLPFTARMLRQMAYRREIPHGGGGNRVTFAGLHIRAITEQFTVEVLPQSKRLQRSVP